MAETVNDSSYTGTAISPEPKVSTLFCGKEIIFEKGKDFTYRYEDNSSPGQAKVIITPAESGRLKEESITKTFTIRKVDQEAVECTLDFTLNEDGKTYTAVIGEVAGAEYSFDGTTWSDSNEKEDCQPGVSYTAYIRRKETATHNAGPVAQTTKSTKKLEQEVPTETTRPTETARPTETTPSTETVRPTETTPPTETARPTEMVPPTETDQDTIQGETDREVKVNRIKIVGISKKIAVR